MQLRLTNLPYYGYVSFLLSSRRLRRRRGAVCVRSHSLAGGGGCREDVAHRPTISILQQRWLAVPRAPRSRTRRAAASDLGAMPCRRPGMSPNTDFRRHIFEVSLSSGASTLALCIWTLLRK
ncbi:hypothetical protein EVAR_22485_1 [Eumeta japonica]|uniref:Uncharacterized protein n=1 Tax=Eumeta variegata TaxID=151549 RepID=A0A4C1VCJ7_EUMVA|nr:hypothetical protein EVAR_22485_1 [Eumeta japonica]